MKLENIRKVCVKCGAKCCFLGGPTVTKNEMNKILKAGFKNVFIHDGKYYDVKSKNGRCPFLKNNLCIVHSFEPLMCRIWPVYPIFKGNKRKFIILDCQLTKYLSTDDVRELKNLAKRLSKELAIISIKDLSPTIKKRLNKFGWYKKIKCPI